LLPTAEARLEENTLVSYRQYVEIFQQSSLGKLTLAKLMPLTIQRYYAQLAKEDRSPR
jgi:site-specific recombinase XerD